jgi:TolB-like protein/class 3 adenylate cyclase/thioredoxin-like negative regulator of GroEL
VRRLAAVLAADIVGYSRLIGMDETGTLAAVKGDLRLLIRPALAAHRGRLVKLMGDGLLAEFASAVEAVRCAVVIQSEAGRAHAGSTPDAVIRYRMGINIGDVVVDGADIHGDGVNIAARLEGLAEPGGILISRSVLEQVAGKLDLTFEPLGERELKNIASPVSVYRIVLDDKAAALGDPQTTDTAAGRPRARSAVGLAIAATLLGGVAAAVWLAIPASDRPTASTARLQAITEEPSIAVLPFANLSSEPDQEWFADGMTDDVITGLARISGLLVIARNSTFVYKGLNRNIQDIARELGVSHVLEGSVRRAGDRIRINAQLIDATTGAHLWADRFDERLSDVFAVQDTVTQRIIAALAVKLSPNDAQRMGQRGTRVVVAYEAFWRGWEHLRRYSPEDFRIARDYFARAVELDPDYGQAHAALALLYFRAAELGWSRQLGVGWDVARLRAGQYLAKARSRPTPLAHRVAAEMYLRVRRFDDALAQAEQAVAMEPGDPENQVSLARTLIFLGRDDEALDRLGQAMRAEVHAPAEYLYLEGLALFGKQQYPAAIDRLREALRRAPDNLQVRVPLAAAYEHVGRHGEARDLLADHFAMVPTTVHGGRPGEEIQYGWPYRDDADWVRLAGALVAATEGRISPSRAGLPDQGD